MTSYFYFFPWTWRDQLCSVEFTTDVSSEEEITIDILKVKVKYVLDKNTGVRNWYKQ